MNISYQLKKVRIFLTQNRFTDGISFLVDCDSLIIEGDVRFEKDVTIKCSVCIKNRQGSQAVIKAGTVIDQDLIF